MVQWLGLGSFTAGAQVQSLVRELQDFINSQGGHIRVGLEENISIP